jgi:hypothetical protein
MTAWPARKFQNHQIISMALKLTLTSRSPSVGGFWAHGFGEGQGTIRVGDDDEGA